MVERTQRLVSPALLVGGGRAAGAPLALASAWTAVTAAGVALALVRRTSRAALTFALVALAVGGARSALAIEGARVRYAAATELLNPPARCVAEARIASSPIVLVRADASEAMGDARADVDLERGTCGDRVIAPFRARVYGLPRDLARGDRVRIVADLAPIYLFHNEELASPWPNVARTGVTASGGAQDLVVVARAHGLVAWIDRARAAVRLRIEATFAPTATALGRALVLGETDLDPDDDIAFRASGLAHLLAVSGTHLVVAVLGLSAILRAIAVRIGPLASRGDVGRPVAAITVPIAWIYADFAGGSGSAIRAAAMLTAILAARALGRPCSPARALGYALAGSAIADPLVASDVSFALSAAATAGLVSLGPPISRAIVRGPAFVRWLLTPVAATLAASIACAPVLLLLAPTLPVLGVAANVVAAPVGELAALPLCLLHAALHGLGPLERGAALLGSGALLGVRWVARVTTATGAVVALPPPTPGQLAALAVTVAAAWAASTRRRRGAVAILGAAAIVALELGARAAGAPTGVLRITMLDVGQGDALLVDLPDGRAMLVDGGGFVGSPVDVGQRVLLPVLRARRRTRLDVAVLSHPHPDHFGGLASALPMLDVGELWDTGQGEAEGAGATYAGLLANLRRRGVAIHRPQELCGVRVVGGALVDVLAPCPGPVPNEGANDNSFVLRLRFGAHSALLAGDAEAAEERRLLASSGSLHADLLKVGHHGSKTSSSPPFLAAVRPSWAFVSCGVRNRFGHPHPNTLASLVAADIPTLRTDRGGEIVWETDGDRVRISRP